MADLTITGKKGFNGAIATAIVTSISLKAVSIAKSQGIDIDPVWTTTIVSGVISGAYVSIKNWLKHRRQN